MKTQIVSFYCDIDDRTYYSDHSRRLRINCNENNISHDVREVQSRGDYRLNCLTKPNFILSILEEKKKPFVWLDVDSLIHNELSVFDELEDKCDVAFAYQGIPPNIRVQFPKASPIYFTYKPVVLDFVKYWIHCCKENEEQNGNYFDHEILMYKVLPEFMPKMNVAALGIEYAIWPGTRLPEGMKPMITMGIADGPSKEKGLRQMGLSEDVVNFNLVGNKK